jgi:hypothetical protein
MPLTRIEPLVGVSRSATARSSVLLPQPDGPMKKEMNSPRATLRSTLLKSATSFFLARMSRKFLMARRLPQSTPGRGSGTQWSAHIPIVYRARRKKEKGKGTIEMSADHRAHAGHGGVSRNP